MSRGWLSGSAGPGFRRTGVSSTLSDCHRGPRPALTTPALLSHHPFPPPRERREKARRSQAFPLSRGGRWSGGRGGQGVRAGRGRARPQSDTSRKSGSHLFGCPIRRTTSSLRRDSRVNTESAERTVTQTGFRIRLPRRPGRSAPQSSQKSRIRRTNRINCRTTSLICRPNQVFVAKRRIKLAFPRAIATISTPCATFLGLMRQRTSRGDDLGWIRNGSKVMLPDREDLCILEGCDGTLSGYNATSSPGTTTFLGVSRRRAGLRS